MSTVRNEDGSAISVNESYASVWAYNEATANAERVVVVDGAAAVVAANEDDDDDDDDDEDEDEKAAAAAADEVLMNVGGIMKS
jgi:hypothetical protein